MRILISNDDGIYSPGLSALAREAARFGEVRIVAPDVEQSSAGHAISSARPLRYTRTEIAGFDAWRVNGTPADCVALGASQWEAVDVVLSGVNLGPNIGNAAWHSGTLAAAKQAALLGMRGIALSTPADAEPDFGALAPHVRSVLELVLTESAPRLVNVNIPPRPRGMQWTHLSIRHYDVSLVPADDPMGRRHYWYVVRPIEDVEEGSDRWAVASGYTSLTPLRLDLTDHDLLATLRADESRD